MSDAEENKEDVAEKLERVFELERVILFSDAVFAIAITLLVLDLKFPELTGDSKGISQWVLYKPLIIRFIGFAISFVFVGSFWMRHVKLMRHLTGYDNRVIILGLFYLFGIVLFPFTASGIITIRPGNITPIYLYIIDINLCTVANYMICRYIIVKKPMLSLTPQIAEKKYIFAQSRNMLIMMLTMLILVLSMGIFLPGYSNFIGLPMWILPIMVFIFNKRIKHLKLAAKAEAGGVE